MTGLDELLQQLFPKQQPTFRPTAIEGLLKPQQAEVKPYSPETFTGLLNEQPSVMRQAGLIGASFAPGAGFSDFAGTFPSAQGGTEPSAAQNLQQGNYLTSALQTLGAFGDAATATGAALGPLGLAAGFGVGSVAKTPRAVQKGVQGLIDSAKPKLDELGFFSQVEKSVMDLGQNKGTGQQFLAQLQNTPGVKPEELQYTGLDTFLANKPTVTKGEIQDYLDTNRVQVQEVQLKNANPYPYKTTDEFMSAISTAERQGNWDEVDRLTQAMESQAGVGGGGTTKFHLGAMGNIQTEIPGGTNYREVLLTLPTKQLSEAEARVVLNARPDAKLSDADITYASNKAAEQYRSSHFDQPNILAHMRINDRTIDGKPTMFVEEIQSDWHQAGRKQGYQNQKEQDIISNEIKALGIQKPIENVSITDLRNAGANEAFINRFDNVMLQPAGGVPDAPFKTSWDELSLKRAIKMASDGGYEQIAFTTGKTQADRYDLSRQVDKIVVPMVNADGTRSVRIDPTDGTTINLTVDKNGVVTGYGSSSSQFSGKGLDEIIGKEIADKVLNVNPNVISGKPVDLGDGSYRVNWGDGTSSAGRYNFETAKQIADNGKSNAATFSGLDLQVGGEGMKGFYDKMLPKKLEKLGKKYGSKPTKTTMQTPDGEVEVWTFNLPKEMRDTVKEQGQPLFQIGAGAAGLGTAGLLATEEEQF